MAWLTAKEYAERSGWSISAVYQRMKKGQIRSKQEYNNPKMLEWRGEQFTGYIRTGRASRFTFRPTFDNDEFINKVAKDLKSSKGGAINRIISDMKQMIEEKKKGSGVTT